MLPSHVKVLAFSFVLSVVSSRAVDPPAIKKPVLVVPPAPVNPELHGPVPVPAEEISDSSRNQDTTSTIPEGLAGRLSRSALPPQVPSFGASQSQAFNWGGNVNIPGVGGFGVSQSASLAGNFGFGGRPGGG